PVIAGEKVAGYGSVAWLQLQAETVTESEGVVKEVYRLNTAGGNPPPTCKGQLAAIEVQYAAEYWFYA
ncbi:hypothetical protein MMC08_006228, partial [Hypocenomyce scalaris]|nr:hypothetical protein [Hypocenomyce scalaris]